VISYLLRESLSEAFGERGAEGREEGWGKSPNSQHSTSISFQFDRKKKEPSKPERREKNRVDYYLQVFLIQGKKCQGVGPLLLRRFIRWYTNLKERRQSFLIRLTLDRKLKRKGV